jgi:hypothetical protein
VIALTGTARSSLLFRLVASGVALALALSTASARADAPRPRVEVAVAAPPDAETELVSVLAELLGRLQVELELRRESAIAPASVVTPPPAPTAALARVFIDATRADVAVLYLVDASWQRVLVRRLPLEHGLDEVAREQLAHIVEAAIQSLAAGGQIGVSRAEASAELGLPSPLVEDVTPPGDGEPRAPATSAPEPAPASRRSRAAVPRGAAEASRWKARAGLGWGLAPWTAETLVQGPELSLRLGVGRGRLSGGGGLGLQYRLRREVRSELAGMVIEGLALRVLAHARYALEPGFAVLASLGGGFDRETFQPRSGRASSIALGPSGTRASAVAALRLGMEVRMSGPVWLGADAGAELDLAPDDYVVLQGGRFVPIAEPLRVRPTFSVLVSVAL